MINTYNLLTWVLWVDIFVLVWLIVEIISHKVINLIGELFLIILLIILLYHFVKSVFFSEE